MKNWIDIIRSEDYFDLIDLNINNIVSTNLRFGSNNARTHYEEVIHITKVPKSFRGVPPTIAFFTPIYRNTDDNGAAHGSKPAPAQRFGVVAFIWGQFTNTALDIIKLNETSNSAVTQCIPEDEFIPHREDGYPAVVEMINLYRHYNHGCIHRVGNHPAIKADYVMASWYLNGEQRRVDGPCGITIKNYQEFWKDGIYRGFKEEEHFLYWALKNALIDEVTTGTTVTPRIPKHKTNTSLPNLSDFLNNLNGDTNLFSNTYFLDPQDEICFGAEFL